MLWLAMTLILMRVLVHYRQIGNSVHWRQRTFSCRSAASKISAPHIEVPAEFPLKPAEEKLFNTLLECIAAQNLPVNLRVAGGWVRDKLLGGFVKNDIDIAVDSMTGLEFMTLLNKWRTEQGRHDVRYSLIKKNPDKSKHLETVQCSLDELSVDFVNLRTETYNENSRIPQMLIGTPDEDAFRRDLTINSLFYNIRTKKVEDFTGRGLQDLQKRIIRTPLPPLVTFTDDPLRVLRAIRFACRFNFTIADELAEACTVPSVHDALKTKVSNERVYAELMLMAQTPQFTRALYLLYCYGILPRLLDISTAQDDNMDKNQVLHAHGQLSQLLLRYIADNNLSQKGANLLVKAANKMVYEDDEARKIFGLLSILSGQQNNLYCEPSRKPTPLTLSVQKQLKFTNKEIQLITSAAYDCNTCTHILSSLFTDNVVSKDHRPMFETLQSDPTALSRVRIGQEYDQTGKISKLELGLLVSECGTNIDNIILLSCVNYAVAEVLREYKSDVLVGLVSEVSKTISTLEQDQPFLTRTLLFRQSDLSKEEIQIASFKLLLSKLNAACVQSDYLLQLVKTWDLINITSKPVMVNGDELQELFGELLKKDVHLYREMKMVQQRWQIVYPQGSKEELIKYLQQLYVTL